jgi:hypothetical protein
VNARSVTMGASLLGLLVLLVMHWAGCAMSAPPAYGIASGRVSEETTDAALDGAFVVLAGYETSTDSEGAFMIDPIEIPTESGEWYLTASHDGYRTYDETFNFSSPGDLALQLARVDSTDTAGTLDGIVRSATTLEGLGYAEVTVSTLVGGTVIDQQTAHTSTLGNWQISGIAIGQCRVQVTLEDWLPDVRLVDVYPGQGSNPLLKIDLVEGTSRVTVTGRVFDVETQDPLVGAVVGDDESDHTTTTGADGSFALTEVLVGERIFHASATGYDPSFVSALILATPDPITIGMAKATGGPPGVPGTVAGTVSLKGGASPEGVKVTLLRRPSGASVDSMTVDATGAFGFLVKPGSYEVVVTKSGYQTARLNVDYVFGVPIRNLAIQLQPAT